MKSADQIKVIVLSLVAVVVMVGIIAIVSLQTTKAASSHGGKHATEEHATEEHATEEHATEEHATEEHATEEHATEEHATEELAIEELATEEHATEEHATVATVAGNPENGSKVFLARTCNACHKISSLEGALGALGPALDGVGTRSATRKPGMDAMDYLKESIEKPDAYLVEGYQNIMTAGLKDQMSDDEYKDLLAYLMSLKS